MGKTSKGNEFRAAWTEECTTCSTKEKKGALKDCRLFVNPQFRSRSPKALQPYCTDAGEHCLLRGNRESTRARTASMFSPGCWPATGGRNAAIGLAGIFVPSSTWRVLSALYYISQSSLMIRTPPSVWRRIKNNNLITLIFVRRPLYYKALFIYGRSLAVENNDLYQLNQLVWPGIPSTKLNIGNIGRKIRTGPHNFILFEYCQVNALYGAGLVSRGSCRSHNITVYV